MGRDGVRGGGGAELLWLRGRGVFVYSYHAKLL